ncbi:MAG: hypothetical protein JW854_17170 [Actinobacteria bacterium]|nr:hypothetical protein [Actinomycetota bacterium]
MLDRQILGLSDTFALTAVLAGYLLAAAIPAFIWSRRSYYHPIWRGIEAFLSYILVALVLGAIMAAASDDAWSVTSGIFAGGSAWAIMGSVVLMLVVFIAASWLGGRSAAGRRRKVKSRKKRKKSEAAA